MVGLQDLIWPTTRCQVLCHVFRKSMLWVAKTIYWPGKSECRDNAGLPRRLLRCSGPEHQLKNSVKGSHISPLLHPEFQNWHFKCQSFTLQPPNHQALASGTTCLPGMFFKDSTSSLCKWRIICLSIHTTPLMQVQWKSLFQQQQKLRNEKNITFLRWGNQHQRQC